MKVSSNMGEQMDFPGGLRVAHAENMARVGASGRAIDQEFVRRGFVGVQAEIEFMQKVFGPKSYDNFLQALASEEGFNRFRAHNETIQEKLEAAQNSTAWSDELWELVLNDQQLDRFSKGKFLRFISEERYEELIRPHIPTLVRAQLEEQENICKFYQEPAINLYDKNTIDLRKEVWNSVMSDAYGALGFEVFKRKRGFDLYAKILNSDYAVIVEPDVTALSRHSTGLTFSRSVYWPLMTYDRFCYLGSPDKKNDSQYISLSPSRVCVAASRLHRYDSTRSFEVAIRADALWYELTTASFERTVIDGVAALQSNE